MYGNIYTERAISTTPKGGFEKMFYLKTVISFLALWRMLIESNILKKN